MHPHKADCIFCKIIQNQIPSHLIVENEHAIAILDAFPVSAGHALILSKHHFVNLMETDNHVLAAMIQLAKQVALKLEANFKDIQGFNYVSNQNAVAKQSVFHTHLHVIPKYDENSGFCFDEKRHHKLEEDHNQVIAKMSQK